MLIRPDNYVTTLGFMIMPKEKGGLGLKGNEAMVYAIIYGFSQDDKSWFRGSLRYLAEWVNGTKQGVQKNLTSLIEKKLIVKREETKLGVKYCEYRATPVDGMQQSCTPMQQSCPNNKEDIYSSPSDISSNEDISSPPKGEVEQIVDYLNAKTGKHFLATAKATQRKIKARLKEGRTVEDFMKVIDIKVKAWKGDPKWDQFLRPETLFTADHFESYLNENPIEEPKPQPKQGYSMKRVTLEDFD